MNTVFTYSILQYKHSLLLGESLNVGVLFSFPEDKKYYFVSTNTHRPKSIYPSFDTSLFSSVIKGIKNFIEVYNEQSSNKNLFAQKGELNIKDFITKNLIAEDSNSLQFSEPINSLNIYDNSKETIEAFSKLLLVDYDIKKEEDRHNEPYIIKKYTQGLLKKNIILEHRVRRNEVIEVKGLKVQFDIAWKNGITHLVKPIGFDLKDGHDITSKSALYLGYFGVLNDYAVRNQYHFDLLVSRPQDENLIKAYNNALDILSQTKAPKTIIPEEKLSDYVEETAQELHKKGIEGDDTLDASTPF